MVANKEILKAKGKNIVGKNEDRSNILLMVVLLVWHSYIRMIFFQFVVPIMFFCFFCFKR